MSYEKKAEKLISESIIASVTAGMISPLPGGVDIPALIIIWLRMLKKMADIYEVDYDEKALKTMLRDALMASGVMIAGVKTLTWLLAITGIGLIATVAINGFLNGIVTWRIGRLFRDSWRKGKQVTFKDIFNELKKAIVQKEI